MAALEAQERRLKLAVLGWLAVAPTWTCYSGGLRKEVRARGFNSVDGNDRTYAELKGDR